MNATRLLIISDSADFRARSPPAPSLLRLSPTPFSPSQAFSRPYQPAASGLRLLAKLYRCRMSALRLRFPVIKRACRAVTRILSVRVRRVKDLAARVLDGSRSPRCRWASRRGSLPVRRLEVGCGWYWEVCGWRRGICGGSALLAPIAELLPDKAGVLLRHGIAVVRGYGTRV